MLSAGPPDVFRVAAERIDGSGGSLLPGLVQQVFEAGCNPVRGKFDDFELGNAVNVERVLGQGGVQRLPVGLGKQKAAGAGDLPAGSQEHAVVKGVLDRGGEWMLGSEPVVRDERSDARRRR